LCAVCSCCAVCLEVRALCAAVHLGACAPAVLCAGACAAGACLCAAVCRCVLCVGACCVCCVRVQVLCAGAYAAAVQTLVRASARSALTDACACVQCVCIVHARAFNPIMARSAPQRAFARVHTTHAGSLFTHTAPIHRCISIHAGERGRSLHPCRLAYLERGSEGTWTTVCSTADGCILSKWTLARFRTCRRPLSQRVSCMRVNSSSWNYVRCQVAV